MSGLFTGGAITIGKGIETKRTRKSEAAAAETEAKAKVAQAGALAKAKAAIEGKKREGEEAKRVSGATIDAVKMYLQYGDKFLTSEFYDQAGIEDLNLPAFEGIKKLGDKVGDNKAERENYTKFGMLGKNLRNIFSESKGGKIGPFGVVEIVTEARRVFNVAIEEAKEQSDSPQAFMQYVELQKAKLKQIYDKAPLNDKTAIDKMIKAAGSLEYFEAIEREVREGRASMDDASKLIPSLYGGLTPYAE